MSDPIIESTHMSRRCDIQQMTPAELAIRDAVIAVEGVGADTRLTDAVCLLSEAQNALADFVDGVPRRSQSWDRIEDMERRLREECATAPSGNHDWVDEIIGLLHVARSQRDDAHRQIQAMLVKKEPTATGAPFTSEDIINALIMPLASLANGHIELDECLQKATAKILALRKVP